MAFSPKFLVLGALLVSLMLAAVLLSGPGAQAGTPTATPAADGQEAAPAAQDAAPAASQAQPKPAAQGSATLDLGLLAEVDNINESDNVRWSLVRSTPAAEGLYNAQSGVSWKELRNAAASGSISLPAGASWSFNDTYGGGPGYKIASGVLAGGQCALATVFRAAAMKAGLVTKAIPHRLPIPGFAHNETVNIWWGSYDLVIQNNTGQDHVMEWELTPSAVKVAIK